MKKGNQAGRILSVCQGIYQARGGGPSDRSSPVHTVFASLMSGHSDVLAKLVEKELKIIGRDPSLKGWGRKLLQEAEGFESSDGREKGFAMDVIDGYYTRLARAYGEEPAQETDMEKLGRAFCMYEIAYRQTHAENEVGGPFYKDLRAASEDPAKVFPRLERKNIQYLMMLRSGDSWDKGMAGKVSKRLRELLPGCGSTPSGSSYEFISGYFAEEKEHFSKKEKNPKKGEKRC